MLRSSLGVRLAVDHWPGERSGILAIHGLASNAQMWWPVASRLAKAGHAVATLDLRGHGRSERPAGPYGFEPICTEIAEVVAELASREPGPWSRPVLAGQSWGGNVVVDCAARSAMPLAGIVCVDGGTIELSSAFADWESCASALAPPHLEGMAATRMEASLRSRHRDWDAAALAAAMANFEISPEGRISPRLPRSAHMEILRSLWLHRPSLLYPRLAVAVLLVPAEQPGDPLAVRKREAIKAAQAAIPTVSVRWFSPADHDVHVQKPDEIAEVIESHFETGFFARAGTLEGEARP